MSRLHYQDSLTGIFYFLRSVDGLEQAVKRGSSASACLNLEAYRREEPNQNLIKPSQRIRKGNSEHLVSPAVV